MNIQTKKINIKINGIDYTIEKFPLSELAQESDLENIHELNFVRFISNNKNTDELDWRIISNYKFEQYLNNPDKFIQDDVKSLNDHTFLTLVTEEQYQSMLRENKFISPFLNANYENNLTTVDTAVVNLNSGSKLRLVKEHFFAPTINMIQLSKNNFASAGIIFNFYSIDWDIENIRDNLKNNENIVFYKKNINSPYQIIDKNTSNFGESIISDITIDQIALHNQKSLNVIYYPTNENLLKNFKQIRNPFFKVEFPKNINEKAFYKSNIHPGFLFHANELNIIEQNKSYQKQIKKSHTLKNF